MGEIFNGKFVTQRFRTQPFLRRGVEGESPEIPRVLEDEVLCAEIERDGRVFGQWRVYGLQEHAPSHAEMAEQEKRPLAAGSSQCECEILRAPGEVHEARSGQRPLQL